MARGCFAHRPAQLFGGEKFDEIGPRFIAEECLGGSVGAADDRLAVTIGEADHLGFRHRCDDEFGAGQNRRPAGLRIEHGSDAHEDFPLRTRRHFGNHLERIGCGHGHFDGGDAAGGEGLGDGDQLLRRIGPKYTDDARVEKAEDDFGFRHGGLEEKSKWKLESTEPNRGKEPSAKCQEPNGGTRRGTVVRRGAIWLLPSPFGTWLCNSSVPHSCAFLSHAHPRKILHRCRRPFRPPGQGATARLPARARSGVDVVPVWNKSNREHTFIGSEPRACSRPPQEAVESARLEAGWHVDADHIRLETVDRFLPHSDFFTIDVADSIGQPAAAGAVAAFVDRHPGTDRHDRHPGHRPALSDDARRGRTDRRQIPPRGPGRRQNLSPYRGGKGSGQLHRRGFDGRDRLAADSTGAARSSSRPWPMRRFPCRPSRRNSPGASTRASITWETCGSSNRSFTTTSRSSPLPSSATACRRISSSVSIQRQRQIFALSDHPPQLAEIRRGRAFEDGRHDVA